MSSTAITKSKSKPAVKVGEKHHWWYVWVFFASYITPPLAVISRFGAGRDFAINVLLTLCGWLPGIAHNFYLQNIRNNTRKGRTPKWAIKSGLVKVKGPREGKHAWATAYDERLPPSAQAAYLAECDASSSTVNETRAGGSDRSSWDGRGEEPPIRTAAAHARIAERNSASGGKSSKGWSLFKREIEISELRDPEEYDWVYGAQLEGGSLKDDDDAELGEREEFYPSSTTTSEHSSKKKDKTSLKKGKKSGGILGNRRGRYEDPTAGGGAAGDRWKRVELAKSRSFVGGEEGRDRSTISGGGSSVDVGGGEYQDEFEREINSSRSGNAGGREREPTRTQVARQRAGREESGDEADLFNHTF